jgi:ribosomal protein L17
MDDGTRDKFKRKLEDMIKDATENEEIARGLQKQAEEKRDLVERLSESGSSSRLRRNKGMAAGVEAQVTELEQEAARLLEIVGELWNKIHEMQEEENSW